MNLCEQYYNRHKIPVSIVKHIKFGSLFFRSNNFPFWKIISISWREPLYEPGSYVIAHKPINRFSHEIICSKSEKEFIVGWNDYEEFLPNIKNKFDLENFQVISNNREAILFAWEIFVYSQEKFLIQKFSHLEKHIFDSINMENDIDLRYFAYLNFTKDYMRFGDKDSVALSFLYQNSISPYVDNYVYWLAKLIENEKVFSV